MSFDSALSAGDLEKLRGTASTPATWDGRLYASILPNTIVFKALINGVPTPGAASITFDTVTTGAYTDIRVDQLLLIGSEDDPRKAEFVGRVRLAPSATVIYINQTDFAIGDNWFVWVIDDFRVHLKLFRDDALTLYADFDRAYTGLPPIVTGLQSAYAGFVDETNFLQLAFSIGSSLAPEVNTTISAYSWSIADGTLVSGSLTGATPTVKFPAGFRWIHVTVTSSGGVATVRHIPIWAHDRASNAPKSGIDSVQITGSVSGWSASISAFEGVDTLLDDTLIVFWTGDEYYNGTAGNLLSRNINMIGRLRTESNQTAAALPSGILADTGYTVEGFAAQLNRLRLTSLYLGFLNTGADDYTEVNSLTVFRAITHVLAWQTTILSLCDVQFDSVDQTWLVNERPVRNGGVTEIVNGMAGEINARMIFSVDGKIEIARQADMLTTTARSALPTVAAWGTSDMIGYVLDVEPIPDTGQLVVAGALFGPLEPTPLLSVAPGETTHEYGDQTRQVDQVLSLNQSVPSAQSELDTRAGDMLADLWRKEIMTIAHPDGYWWLQPCDTQWYTLTVASSSNTRGRGYSAERWRLAEVSVNYDNIRGSREVQAKYEIETSGALAGITGRTLPFPSEDEFKFDTPDLDDVIDILLPPIPIDFGPVIPYDPTTPMPLDPSPGVPTERGKMYLASQDGYVSRVTWTSGGSSYADISPSAAVRAVLGDAICLKLDAWNYRKAWLLCKYGLAMTPDITATTPAWSVTSIPREDTISLTNTTYDLTVALPGIFKGTADAGVAFEFSTPVSAGTFVAGTGWQSELVTGSGNDDYYITLGIRLACPTTFPIGASQPTTVKIKTTITSDVNQTVNSYWIGRKPDGSQLEQVQTNGSIVLIAGVPQVVEHQIQFSGSAGNENKTTPLNEIVLLIGARDDASAFVLTISALTIENWVSCSSDTPSAEEFVGDFQSVPNRKNMYCWLSKKTVNGVDYLYFNRSLSATLSSRYSVQIARYVTTMAYSFTVSPHNWRWVYVSAGDPANSDAFVYRSFDGGSTFTSSAVALLTRGGQVWWNWSTQTANTRNTLVTNLMLVRGLDGSNNLKARRGIGGADVTAASGAAKYGLTALSLWVNPRDLDYQMLALSDNTTRKSTDGGGSWSAGATLTGGGSAVARALWGIGKDLNFVVATGYRIFSWSTNFGTAWTSDWTAYDTFRGGAFGSGGETLVNAQVDLVSAFKRPVAYE